MRTDGINPVARDLLIILVIGVTSSLKHVFTMSVGTGSKSQVLFLLAFIIFVTSASDSILNDECDDSAFLSNTLN